MHDDDFEHEHYYEQGDPTEMALATGELVRLTTVGIDVGSSTSHLMFSVLFLKRQGEALSTRYVVVLREVVYRSPVLLTPYTSDNTIDAKQLGDFVREAYAMAGLKPKEVDSGAIILTGEALKRENARAIADTIAGESGRFVCATAGHNLEAVLAAHGSGAAALSYQEHRTILNVDMGGGTTKLALLHDGDILATAAVNVGGRLVAADSEGRLARIEPAARQVAGELGIELQLGSKPAPDTFARLADKLAEVLVEVIQLSAAGHHHHDHGHDGHDHGLSPLAERLMLTPTLHSHHTIEAITFSGGVSEFLYEREDRDFGDIGRHLADAVRRRMDAGALPARLEQAGERIRATAIGASQFTVQVSGNTIDISSPKLLPLRNLPVIRPRLPKGDGAQPLAIAQAIRQGYQRLDLVAGEQPVALALAWNGTPSYESLYNLAAGISRGLQAGLAAGHPLVVVFNSDCANIIGHILREDLKVANDVISIDGIELQEFDFIDIGEILQPANAVPVVVKSLVFPALNPDRAEMLD
ncbi:MAG TPA: ethanolamine ammonia-lyase reactivating factor EutA [Chloroflexota bacterium]|nr:ethanolamine ammonia-lyase reactivating factor EutA [Chloroflexota bacterium]